MDFRNIETFEIPNDVSKCLIVGGPVSYEDAKKSNELVKLIHEVKIPFLIKKLLERDIYTIYISSNMVGKDNLYRSELVKPKPNIEYGKMKFLCEKEILLHRKNKPFHKNLQF